MAIYYLQIKQWHVWLVLCSGGLFAVRAALSVGWHWRSSWLDWTSYVIDSLLLTAALMLLVILGLNPLLSPWLGLKLLLLPLYVVLGMLAMRAGPRRRRLACLLGAIATYLLMYGIARAHHPLGWWQLLANA